MDPIAQRTSIQTPTSHMPPADVSSAQGKQASQIVPDWHEFAANVQDGRLAIKTSLSAEKRRRLFEWLASSGHEVHTLRCQGEFINDTNMPEFAAGLKRDERLQALHFSFLEMDAEDAGLLCVVLDDALQSNRSLHELRIFHSNFAGAAVAALSEVLKRNSSIHTLDLALNGIGKEGAASLSKLLKAGSSLRTLRLSANEIGDEGAASLSEALQVGSILQTLDLLRNNLGEQGAASLSKALRVNSSLQTLNLGWNSLGENGGVQLSEALKANGTLQTLNLAGNDLGDKAAASLSEALKVNRSIQRLDLSNNSINESGAISLFEALKTNFTLQALDLRANDMGDGAMKALLGALRINKTIVHIEMDGMENHPLYGEIQNRLQENRELAEVRDKETPAHIGLGLLFGAQYPLELAPLILNQVVSCLGISPQEASDTVHALRDLSGQASE